MRINSHSLASPLLKISRRARRSRYRTTHLYIIDSNSFEVSGAAYEALILERDYRIFFGPYSHKLVSIEPLHTDIDLPKSGL